MVESNNSNNQFYTQYHTPRPTRIQTPRNNIIAYSIANKRRRDNQAKRKKEWNDVVRRVRASLNPTPVRTQRIKSTPRRVNTTQTPVNYNKIVKEAINESNAVRALLNLNRKPDANKQKKANSMTEANKDKIRKQKREWARKRREKMTEADKEAKRQRDRESYRKRMESMTEANKQKKRESMTEANKQKKRESMTEANREKIRKQSREWARKRTASMTEADKEAKRQHKREWYRKRVESMTEANKQKKRVNSMTEADKEKMRKRKREWARKRAALMTEADKEAKRQYQRELYRKRREKNLWSYGII
tara:strand:- start:96 stop:1013 length:918 start_codon:yes stop_codon:yes gene_type:complete